MKNLCWGFLLCLASFGAQAVTIDFEEFAGGEGEPILSNGFVFTSDADAIVASGSIVPGLRYGCNAGCTLSFEAADSGLFSLSSLDVVLEFAGPGPAISDTVMLTGFFAGGTQSSLQQVMTFDAIPGSAAYTFMPDWQNLARVEISGNLCEPACFGAVTIDNVMVSPATVPIPAAVWLFGSALGGLGWMRRS